jgi:hypothetical protein
MAKTAAELAKEVPLAAVRHEHPLEHYYRSAEHVLLQVRAHAHALRRQSGDANARTGLVRLGTLREARRCSAHGAARARRTRGSTGRGYGARRRAAGAAARSRRWAPFPFARALAQP